MQCNEQSKQDEPHTGHTFDDFLKDEDFFKQVQTNALKRALAEKFDDEIQSGKLGANAHELRRL
jgi:hypothetical protein